MLATFLVKGEKNAKERVKTHLPKFGTQMCLWLTGKQLWAARIRAPRSMVRIRFRSPLAFLPLSGGGGGGGPESRAHLSDGYDQSAQINDAQEIPDPHCLSTFNKGGGGPESGAHLPSGRDQSAQINGAQAIPPFSAALLLINVGPSPAVSPPEPPLPCCLSSTSPHSMAPPQSIILLPAAMCPPSLPVTCPFTLTVPFFLFLIFA
jgi:hypothetical protein